MDIRQCTQGTAQKDSLCAMKFLIHSFIVALEEIKRLITNAKQCQKVNQQASKYPCF